MEKYVIFDSEIIVDKDTVEEYQTNYGSALSEDEVYAMMCDAVAENYEEACAMMNSVVPGRILALSYCDANGSHEVASQMLDNNLNSILTMFENDDFDFSVYGDGANIRAAQKLGNGTKHYVFRLVAHDADGEAWLNILAKDIVDSTPLNAFSESLFDAVASICDLN